MRFSSRFAVPASCYVGPFHVYQVSFRFLSIKWILLQSRVKINSTCVCFCRHLGAPLQRQGQSAMWIITNSIYFTGAKKQLEK